MRAYNFFVCEPKFTNFFSPNMGGVVVDHALFQFSMCGSFPEIFAIEVDSCLKWRRNSTWVGQYARLKLFCLWTKVQLFFAQRGRGWC